MPPVTIRQSDVNSFLNSTHGPVNRHLQTLALATRAVAQRRMKRDSGRLADTLIVEQGFLSGRPNWHVKTNPDLNYGLAVHEGSRTHIVRATKAKALHFFWNNRGGIETLVPRAGGFRTHIDKRGRLLIGKGFVVIPAQPPTYFLTRALAEVVQGTVV